MEAETDDIAERSVEAHGKAVTVERNGKEQADRKQHLWSLFPFVTDQCSWVPDKVNSVHLATLINLKSGEKNQMKDISTCQSLNEPIFMPVNAKTAHLANAN